MRVRPFFWILLASVSASILIFAATVSAYKTLPMHAHIDQVSTVSTGSTSVRLSLTDPEGMPIDRAKVTPYASMLTMPMGPQQISIEPLGRGLYQAQIHFSMAGFWKIEFVARADGFEATRQSLQLTVG
jgi:nitrogen fixation protein FixH